MNNDILIVDDDVFPEADELRKYLVNAGYSVYDVIQESDKAFKFAVEKRPTIIFVDISLLNKPRSESRDTEGIKFAKKICSEYDAHIIFYTAWPETDMEALIEKLKYFGPYDFIAKPSTRAHILAIVKIAFQKLSKKRVFISYNHVNRNMLNECHKFLKSMISARIIECFIDKISIKPGEKWKEMILRKLSNADIVILLVSIEFVNSEFICDYELPIIHDAADSGRIRVITVFVNPIPRKTLERLDILKYKGINLPKDYIASWSEIKRSRECWVKIAEILEGE